MQDRAHIPPTLRGKVALLVLLMAIIIDVLSMNVYRSYDVETGDWIYFTGQSLTYTLLITSFALATRGKINTVLMLWLPFAVSNTIQTVIGYNQASSTWEWIAFAIAMTIMIFKILK